MEGGNGVVAMVNSDNVAITEEIINSAAEVYKWKGFYNPLQRPKIISVQRNILENYVGEYKFKVEWSVFYSEPGWD